MEREAVRPIDRLIAPFSSFIRVEASAGLLLVAATVAALAVANSTFSGAMHSFWETPITVGAGDLAISKPLLLWVNDGLMAIFFFVVGLEIKREIIVGELSTVRQAALPAFAALGGMIAPALIFVALNTGTEHADGWGVPMATDIAFALGVLAILGSRVPVSLKIFLTALAIIDDLGAIIVIAFFFSHDISVSSLLIGGGFFAALVAANRLGIRHPAIYFLLAFGLWAAFLKGGIHPTLAGVISAMTVPTATRIDSALFVSRSRESVTRFVEASRDDGKALSNRQQQYAAENLESLAEQVQPPLLRLEHWLHPWVVFLIMPVFALANAAVTVSGDFAEVVRHTAPLGVIGGLVVGKPLGILLACWLAVRLGVGALPDKTRWLQLARAGSLAGIGFTMSLFIANLAFGGTSVETAVKIGILLASVVSAVAGASILIYAGRQTRSQRAVERG